MKNSSDTIGNRTHDLPACSAVPQPTAPPRAPIKREGTEENWEALLYSVTRQGLDLDASHIHVSVVNILLPLLQLL
jgi:hypothetical protein